MQLKISIPKCRLDTALKANLKENLVQNVTMLCSFLVNVMKAC